MPLARLLAFGYGVCGLIACPALLIISLREPSGVPGVVFSIALLVIYPLAGFAAGFLGALMYNFAAKYVGGLEVEVDEKFDAADGPDAAKPSEGKGRIDE